jgi:hypothetical protein
LNPYIKPYRQYRSAFLDSAITPSDSDHPQATVLKHLTAEVRQSPALTDSQEVETNITTSAPSPSSQSFQAAPSPASIDTTPQSSTAPTGTEVAESTSTSLAEEVSQVNHT